MHGKHGIRDIFKPFPFNKMDPDLMILMITDCIRDDLSFNRICFSPGDMSGLMMILRL